MSERDAESTRSNVRTKFFIVCLLNLWALTASYFFFHGARVAAQQAYHNITDTATQNMLLKYPASCCAMSPTYSPLPTGGIPVDERPSRMCNTTQISYFTFDPAVDENHTFFCSVPLNTTDSSTLANVTQAMADCGMIRYLSEDLPDVGYRLATRDLSSNISVYSLGEPTILDYYFKKQFFDFMGAQFFPSPCFELNDTSPPSWFGKAYEPSIMPGTLELLTQQPKSLWFELFPNDMAPVSCSPFPEPVALRNSTTCLAKALLLQQANSAQFQCENQQKGPVAASNNMTGATLTVLYCERYSCFNEWKLNVEYYSEFNDQVTLLQRQTNFTYLGLMVVYEDLNNIYIALMGVFCATVLTTCISIIVSSTKFWHLLPLLGPFFLSLTLWLFKGDQVQAKGPDIEHGRRELPMAVRPCVCSFCRLQWQSLTLGNGASHVDASHDYPVHLHLQSQCRCTQG